MANNPEIGGNKEKPVPHPAETPDLQSQLEALLDSVWDAEANWSLDDRIDLALKAHRRAA